MPSKGDNIFSEELVFEDKQSKTMEGAGGKSFQLDGETKIDRRSLVFIRNRRLVSL